VHRQAFAYGVVIEFDAEDFGPSPAAFTASTLK
jgi:hypothetical protein